MAGPYPYLNNIPQPTDQLSVSQGNLLTNFQAIQNLIDVDHADFATSNAGKHNQTTFPSQASPPTFTSTDVGWYNYISPTTGYNELYVHKITLAGTGTQDLPVTGSIVSTTAVPTSGMNGWTFIPSGLILKWGSMNVGATSLQTIIFPTGANIPAFTYCFNVSVTGFASDGTATYASLASFTNLQFQASLSTLGSGTNSIYYIAIGF